MHNGRCLHIRWTFNGIHGDTVAQESMEGSTKFPAVLNDSYHSFRFSLLEGGFVHMTGTCYTSWDQYCTVIGRAFDAMHPKSGYRMAAVAALNATYCDTLSTLDDMTYMELLELRDLFGLFPKNSWHLWLPLVLPTGQEWENRRNHLVCSLLTLVKANVRIDLKVLLEKIKKKSSAGLEKTGFTQKPRTREDYTTRYSTALQELRQAEKELAEFENQYDDDCEEATDNDNPISPVSFSGMDEETVSENSRMSVEGECENIAREIATVFMGDPDRKVKNKKVVNLDESTFLQRYGRELLDPMHHIPNFTVLILKFLQGDITPSLKNSGFPAFFEAYWKCFRCPEDPENPELDSNIMEISPRVNALAMQRIHELIDSGKAPNWLSEETIIPSYYAQMRDEECILFSLCYFSVVYRDSMDIPFVFCAKNALECIGYLYNCTSDLNEAASVQCILNIFVSLLQSMTYPKFGNVSLLNSQFYWMVLAFYGDAKLGDCFQNESALRLVKGACNNNPDVVKTTCKRMQLYEICDGIIHDMDTYRFQSYSEYSNSEELLSLAGDVEAAFVYNFCDDYELWKDNSVGRTTYLDQLVGQQYGNSGNPQLPSGFSFAQWDRKVFRTIKVNGKLYNSALYSETIDDIWVYDNSRMLAVTRGIDSNVRVFMVCGYVMRTLNSHPYPLALCQMIPTVSGSSFFSTHYHFINTSQVTRRLLPISLTRLQLFKCRLYRLDDVGLLFLSPESICIRQTTRDSNNIYTYKSSN